MSPWLFSFWTTPIWLVSLSWVDRSEQMAHPVGLEEQAALERRPRHGLEIIGAVEPGGAVEVGRADLAQRLEIVAGRVFGAVEHQMLEQMGEAGLAVGLVLRADIVPDGDCDDRRLAVLVDDDLEAVVEGELLVGNVDLADELGDGGGLGRRGATAGAEMAAVKAESSAKGISNGRIRHPPSLQSRAP